MAVQRRHECFPRPSALRSVTTWSWAALAPVLAEVVVFRAPAQGHDDSISGRLAQLGVGDVPHWSLPREVNTERCHGDRPLDHGVTEGSVPRLGSREQSRPGVAGPPAEAGLPVLGRDTPVTVTVGAAGRVDWAVRLGPVCSGVTV